MEVVCCPPNRSAMSIPTISLSLLPLPSLYFMSTRTWKRMCNTNISNDRTLEQRSRHAVLDVSVLIPERVNTDAL